MRHRLSRDVSIIGYFTTIVICIQHVTEFRIVTFTSLNFHHRRDIAGASACLLMRNINYKPAYSYIDVTLEYHHSIYFPALSVCYVPKTYLNNL